MSLTKKIAHNTAIQIVGKASSNFLGVVAIALMTRTLGPEGFGGYTAAASFLQFFAALVDGGLNVLAGQMLGEILDTDPEKISKENRLLGTMMRVRIVMAIVLYGVSIGFSYLFPYDATIRGGIALLTIGFVFISLQQLIQGLFQREMQMQHVMWAENLARTVFLIGMVVLFWQHGGLMAALAVAVIGHVVNFWWLWLKTKQLLPGHFEFDRTLLPEIWHRTWPLGLSLLFNLIYWKADALIMSWSRPMAEVGLYGAAYRVLEVMVQLPLLFAGLVLPILSGAWALGDQERFKRMLQKSLDILLLAGLPLFVGTLFVSREVMRVLAGADFIAAGDPLRVLMLANLMIFVGSLLTHAVVALQEQRRMLKFYGITAILSLIGYWLLIPRFGMIAAAWLTVMSEALIVFSSWWSVRRVTGFQFSFGRIGRIALATFIMALFLWWGQDFNFWIQLFGAVAVYGAAAFVFQAVEPGVVREVIG